MQFSIETINNIKLENRSSELMYMMISELNWEDALEIRYNEGIEDSPKEQEEIARNTLAKGIHPEMIGEITGLDTETVMTLQTG